MNGFGFDEDEDMIVCPDCGHKSYPEVGFGGHMCAVASARHAREAEDFERRFTAGGRRCRITVEIECYDSDHAIDMALGEAASESYRLRKGTFIEEYHPEFEHKYRITKR